LQHGRASPAVHSAFAPWFADNVCDPLGQVFLRMLSFVVIPLVFASLQTVPPRLQRPELDPNGAARASLVAHGPGQPEALARA